MKLSPGLRVLAKGSGLMTPNLGNLGLYVPPFFLKYSWGSLVEVPVQAAILTGLL